MEQKLFELASSQGLWATLSVALIFYILRSQEKRDARQEEREEKYQEVIKQLTYKLEISKEIKKDIKSIKTHIIKTDET